MRVTQNQGGSSENSANGREVVVRAARAEDRDAVLAFCARIWDGYDYIPHVWDGWLADTRGALLVAIEREMEQGRERERPVGLVHVRKVSDDEVWMEGIRVDPDRRRQGIARRLSSASLAAARERGATVARLMTTHENSASQQLAAGFGYVKVAEMVRYEAPALSSESLDEPERAEEEPEDGEAASAGATEAGAGASVDVAPGARLVIPGPEDFERVWSWMERSSLLPLTAGLGFGDWSARALSEVDVRAALDEGRLWLLEEWETIQALALLEERAAYTPGEPGRLHLRTLDGSSEGIGRLALVLREEAGLRGLGSVVAWLPNLLILRDAMAGAGYEADEDTPMWVYARDLA